MIKSDQRRMINSLLDKLYKKIAIDRLLVKEADRLKLIIELEKVLKEIANHFRNQFKKRKFKEKSIVNK
jgi:hypothetical protein